MITKPYIEVQITPLFYSPLFGQKGACLFHTFGYDSHCHPHSLENPAVLLPASQRDSNRKGCFIIFIFSIVTLTMCQHRQQWLSVCFASTPGLNLSEFETLKPAQNCRLSLFFMCHLLYLAVPQIRKRTRKNRNRHLKQTEITAFF